MPADAASSVTTTTLPTMDAIQSQVDKPASDDKRYSVRGLIESIPTDKNDLFNFNIEWKMVDEVNFEELYLYNNLIYVFRLYIFI